MNIAKRNFFAGIIGNVFEHYDNALFGLLAPFIAPLFFPNSSPLSALILTYGLFTLGIVSKPIGALVFGYIGDRFGRKRALYLTLMGMAIITCMMGCLPTYETVGILAPILLALCRFLQSFFSAGETTGGAIFVLEQAEEGSRSFLSSLYDSSSILGIFLASGVVTFFSFQKDVFEAFWRIPFFMGSLCGVCGIGLRLFTKETHEQKVQISLREHFQQVWEHRSLIVLIALVAGFSYSIYTHIFTLMNGFLPFVSTITKQEACAVNTVLLLLDLLLLPLFGLVAKKWTKERLMGGSAVLMILLALPLFLLLQEASMQSTIFVRIVLVTIGVAFAASYHHWSQERVPKHLRYTVVATATAIGSQVIGLPSATISLWLYQKTNWVGSPAIYLVLTAGLALFAISGLAIKKGSRELSK